jgi:hypothetical protein
MSAELDGGNFFPTQVPYAPKAVSHLLKNEEEIMFTRISLMSFAQALLIGGFASAFGTTCQAGNFVEGTWVAPGSTANVVKADLNAGGNGPMAVCRAPQDGGQQVGKVWENQCWFEFAYKDVATSTYTVLVNDPKYVWVNAYAGTYGSGPGRIPDNAVNGGDAGVIAKHVLLGICQAFVPNDKTWHPGKFYAGKCNIAWGGLNGKVDPNMHVRLPDADSTVRILVKTQ